MAPSNERLEAKVDRLQETTHENHLELLGILREDREAVNKEIVALKLTTERHSGYFSGIVKLLGLGGAISSWLAFRDIFSNK